MTNIGWIGLGKLGLPCALVFANSGHRVTGYDVSDQPRKILEGVEDPPLEDGIQDLLREPNFALSDTLSDVVAASDVCFIAVQTPHDPAYGGEQPMPNERADFEYSYLVQAVRQLAECARSQAKHVTLVIVSTVLPGTFNRYLRPLANDYVTLVYNPFFIAMGTTIADFKSPEFVLIGADKEEDWQPLLPIYRRVHDRPFMFTSIESAELTKVAYNTFISLKIIFANNIMEICEKTGADCDDVSNILAHATDRVISPKYLHGGMGDGGACHPRDLIAMSWFAQRLNLSADLMGYAVRAREAQTQWLADLVMHWVEQTGLPVVLLGKAYKAGSNLTAGSPALLLAGMLKEPLNRKGRSLKHWDHLTDSTTAPMSKPSVFVIATNHVAFHGLDFPTGSVVLDPFGCIPDQTGVTVLRIGRKL